MRFAFSYYGGYMLEEFKGIRAIYPPAPAVRLPCACYSCGKDVYTDKGFVDMAKLPFKGYLCANCTIVTIGGMKAAELQMYAQERYRENKQ